MIGWIVAGVLLLVVVFLWWRIGQLVRCLEELTEDSLRAIDECEAAALHAHDVAGEIEARMEAGNEPNPTDC